MRWTRDQLHFDFLDEMVDDRLVTMEIGTPVGQLVAMGIVHVDGRSLVVTEVHMHGVGFGANELGVGTLRFLADVLLEELDYDALVVEGAVRTTGANPGARPRPVRFTRRAGPSVVGQAR